MTESLKCPENMAYIPAGPFEMGSTVDLYKFNKGWGTQVPKSTPVIQPYISAYCMDKYEATNEDTGIKSKPARLWYEALKVPCDGIRNPVQLEDGEDARELWETYQDQIDFKAICGLIISPHLAREIKPRQPRQYISWDDALAHCQAQGKYLPTEAQWEKAARGPNGYDYATKSGNLIKGEAHFDENELAEVGSYPPNGYGIYDMTGNVDEWTADWYAQSAYQYLSLKDPTGPNSGKWKVIRGGSYHSSSDISLSDSDNEYKQQNILHVAHRSWGFKDGSSGFRCAADPIEPD